MCGLQGPYMAMLDVIVDSLIFHCACVRVNHMDYATIGALSRIISTAHPLFPCVALLSSPSAWHSCITTTSFRGQKEEFLFDVQ